MPASRAVADFPYPLSPEQAAELERASAYYGGAGLSSQAPPVDFSAPPPPPPVAPDPGPASGPPPAIPASFAPPEVLESRPPPPPAPLMSVMPPPREPVSFERAPPPATPSTPKPVQRVASGPSDAFGVEAARRGLRGTFEGDKEALSANANAEKGRAVVLANGASQIAREKEEDAAIQRLETEEAAKHFKGYSDETQRQIDAVKSTQIGSRLYQDGGSKALAIIGGIFGGMFQGLNHTASNPFIDQMNKNIDRDIALQEKNLDNRKQAVAERRGVLADMRNSFKDEQLAKLQARNLYYEAFKDQIASEAAQYDSPVIQAKADMAITAVSREQAKLDLEGAIKKASDARAAAAAQLARQEHLRKAALEERAMRVQEGKLLVDAAEQEKKSGKASADQLEKLSSAMTAKPELSSSKKVIADLEKKLANPETGEIDGSKRVPGTGPVANFKESWWNKPLIGAAQNPIPGLHLSDEERIGRQDWDRLGIAYKHAVTGAGGSDEEAKNILQAFQGANTPAEQANAVRLAKAMLSDHESRIYAGYPKEVVDEYKRRTFEENADVPRTARRFAP